MSEMSVLDLINEVAADRDHIQDISVLPLMCGTGKSTAISYKIKETIEQAKETGHGLLIITDRVDRMDDYMHPYIPDLLQHCPFITLNIVNNTVLSRPLRRVFRVNFRFWIIGRVFHNHARICRNLIQ